MVVVALWHGRRTDGDPLLLKGTVVTKRVTQVTGESATGYLVVLQVAELVCIEKGGRAGGRPAA